MVVIFFQTYTYIRFNLILKQCPSMLQIQKAILTFHCFLISTYSVISLHTIDEPLLSPYFYKL